MSKEYITTIIQRNPEQKSKLQHLKVGDEIIFCMPSFCSGDYVEQVKEDDIGLYVSDWYGGCYGWSIRRRGMELQSSLRLEALRRSLYNQ